MGIELPGWLQWLAPIVVGSEWPEGDETALMRLSQSWEKASGDVETALRNAENAVREARANMEGEAAQKFDEFWKKIAQGGEGALPKLQELTKTLSSACKNCALQVEYAKLSIIAALILLAAQIAAMIAAAFVSFGASTAGIPVAQMATRVVVQGIFRRLIQTIMQRFGTNLLRRLVINVGVEVAAGVAIDAGVQLVQMAKGSRDSWDTSLTLDAAKSGAISGLVGGAVSGGMGKAFGEGIGDGIGKTMGKNALEEGVTGAVSAAAEGVMSGNFNLKDVALGGTSGAASGAVGGAKENFDARSMANLASLDTNLGNVGGTGDGGGRSAPPAAPPVPDLSSGSGHSGGSADSGSAHTGGTGGSGGGSGSTGGPGGSGGGSGGSHSGGSGSGGSGGGSGDGRVHRGNQDSTATSGVAPPEAPPVRPQADGGGQGQPQQQGPAQQQ
ncbi:WXG100 family type VII secretion target, partial [Crossiella cryophila]|uniref:WXG100 family type VII secretion target n=1 Tax=Crossiella cryophila TaxID=43355 RepID=UPI0031EFE816